MQCARKKKRWRTSIIVGRRSKVRALRAPAGQDRLAARGCFLALRALRASVGPVFLSVYCCRHCWSRVVRRDGSGPGRLVVAARRAACVSGRAFALAGRELLNERSACCPSVCVVVACASGWARAPCPRPYRRGRESCVSVVLGSWGAGCGDAPSLCFVCSLFFPLGWAFPATGLPARVPTDAEGWPGCGRRRICLRVSHASSSSFVDAFWDRWAFRHAFLFLRGWRCCRLLAAADVLTFGSDRLSLVVVACCAFVGCTALGSSLTFLSPA